jgi:hypothetical protein
MKTSRAVVLAVCCVAVVQLAAQSPMRPGRWEATMQMQMANMPMQMPEMKTARCVTAEELKDPVNSVPNASPGDNTSCKVSDYKVTGSTVTWKVACTAPQTMSGSGEMTFVGDSYTGLMKMLTPQGDMSMKMTGKRLGDCTP